MARRRKIDKKELKRIERQLLALGTRFRRDLQERLGSVANVSARRPTELLDMVADGESDYMSAVSAQAGSATIEEIDFALDKIREGTYGICEDCGGAISARRLKARAFAVLCIRCKEQQERSDRGAHPLAVSSRPGVVPHVDLNDRDVDREASMEDVFRDISDMELTEML
jgi:DnaK suppressor protein